VSRRNFTVAGICSQGFHCGKIEALHIHQRLKAAARKHIDKVACNAAHTETA
jgi:hypothetical protein